MRKEGTKAEGEKDTGKKMAAGRTGDWLKVARETWEIAEMFSVST